ncbi:hypothetical protein DVB88_02510 [Tsukamurella pulmonis]|nr:hypothetical protein DVB88_02510 [Tsukamurella pulmonis]
MDVVVVAAAGRTVVVATGIDGAAERGSVEVVVEVTADDCGDGVGALEVSVDPQLMTSEAAATTVAMDSVVFTDGTVAAFGEVGPANGAAGVVETRARNGAAYLSVPGGSLSP